MRAGGQFRPRLKTVSTWTDDDAAGPIDVDAGRADRATARLIGAS